MRRRRLILGTVVLSIILVLTGARFIVAPAFIATPNAVHIVVTDIQLPSPHQTIIFDRQFSHQANAIYQQLVAGGQLTNGTFQGCPAMSNQLPYYHYDLTFFHRGVNVATATSDATGCADITVNDFDGSTAMFFWDTDDHVSFWIRLHRLVNAPEPINTCIGIDLAAKTCITISVP